jgi:hypothetical protein
MRLLISVDLYPNSWCANGYMQPLVFPLPTAPMMAMPVNRPRSGIVSQCGATLGSQFVGVMPLAEHQEEIPTYGRVRVRRERRMMRRRPMPDDEDIR